MSSLGGYAFEWLLSKIIAFGPSLTKENGVLVARSNWRSQLFSLGFSGRTVRVDPHQKAVKLEIRKAWAIKTFRRIEFTDIEEILYGYAEVSSDSFDTSSTWGAHTVQDLFTVGLLLKGGEQVTLFRFYGQGGFVNNGILPDWMYWDEYLVSPYTQGNQESDSLMFADLLSRMIGVPIGNPPL